MKKTQLPNIPMSIKPRLNKYTLSKLSKTIKNSQFVDTFIFHKQNNSRDDKNQTNTVRVKSKTRCKIYTKKQCLRTQRDNKQNSFDIVNFQTMIINQPQPQEKNNKIKFGLISSSVKKQPILNLFDDFVHRGTVCSKIQNNIVRKQSEKKIRFKKSDWVKKKVWKDVKKDLKKNKNKTKIQNQVSPWTKVNFSQLISLQNSFTNFRKQ